jgi:hypothetical protein
VGVTPLHDTPPHEPLFAYDPGVGEIRDDLTLDDWIAILDAAHIRAAKLTERLMGDDRGQPGRRQSRLRCASRCEHHEDHDIEDEAGPPRDGVLICN